VNARPREIREVAVGAVLLGVVGWGIGPLLVRGMSVSGVSVSFYRMWLAVPVMVVLARMFGEPLDRRVLRVCALPGVLFAFAMMFGQFVGAVIVLAGLAGTVVVARTPRVPEPV